MHVFLKGQARLSDNQLQIRCVSNVIDIQTPRNVALLHKAAILLAVTSQCVFTFAQVYYH